MKNSEIKELTDKEIGTAVTQKFIFDCKIRYVDNKTKNISLDDCAKLSVKISKILDTVIDEESGPYNLEVSSPGLNRPLRKEKDFIKVIGSRIKLKMAMDINGQKNFAGNLKDYNNRTIYLETDGKLIELPFDEVEKSNLIFDFDDGK